MQKGHEILKKIYNLKCDETWRGFQSAVFFEFAHNGDKKNKFSLCLDFCKWKIFLDGKEIANSNSELKEISEVIKLFEGKKIIDIKIDEKAKQTRIFFSDNLEIYTSHESENSQWYVLFEKDVVIIGKNCSIKIKDKNSEF